MSHKEGRKDEKEEWEDDDRDRTEGLKANQREKKITICMALTQELVVEATLATWPQNKVAEQGSGIGAMNKEEEGKDHDQEHNCQEGKEEGKENQVIESSSLKTTQ